MTTIDSSFAEKYDGFHAWSLYKRTPEDYEQYLIHERALDRLYDIAVAQGQDVEEFLTSLEQDAFGG